MATSYQYDPIGADNGLFAPALIRGDPVSEQAVRDWEAAHLKKPPAYDPWYVPPPPPPVPGLTPDASTQRDRIAMQMVQGAGPGGGGDVATSIGPTPGFTTLGKGDPDNPTPPVNEPTPPPTPDPTPTPPDEGVEQGPATPTGVVTSAPMPDVNNPLGQQFGPPAPTTAPKGDLADKDQTQFQSPPEQSHTPTDPTPPQKGEPTAEEDAAALAAANTQAINEGFMSPEGVPGPNTTTTTENANLAAAPSITGVTNQQGQNLSFAPPQGPLGLTVAPPDAPAPPAPVAAPTTADQLGQQAAQQAQANLAAAIAAAQDSVADVAAAPPGPTGPTSVAPTAIGVNQGPSVALGLGPAPATVTGLQGPFGDPNQTSTASTVAQSLANNVAPEAQVSNVALSQAIANAMAVNEGFEADVGTAPSPSASTPGLSAAEAADVGTAPANAQGYGYGPSTDSSPSAQEAASLAADTGISPAEAAAAIAGAQDSVSGVEGDPGATAAAEAGSVGTEGSASADGGSGIGDGVGGGGIGW